MNDEQSDKIVDEEEFNHWNNVMRTFLFYEEFVIFDLERRQRHLNRLPNHYSARLPPITYDKIKIIDDAARMNQYFFEDMIQYHVYSSFHMDANEDDSHPTSYLDKIPSKDKGPMIKFDQQHRNQAVLHSLYREWSLEGMEERNHTFELLINQLKIHLPISNYSYDKKVLVPGCGLGRLPLEIASLGYKCEGNEFSAFMAIASNFVLNGITKAYQYSIYPWISNVSNVIHMNDVIKEVQIPDVSASILLESAFEKSSSTIDDIDNYPRFSMAAGDFVEIYGPKNINNTRKVDVVVTCFFLDTAPVVFDYIETILHTLVPGGLWINLGPLLYHWEKDEDSNNDPRYEQSIELSYEELKHVIQGYGFEYLHESWHDCSYTKCNNSMMWTTYRSVLFTVQKPLRQP